MKDLQKDFSLLGFDVGSLENLIYLSKEPEEPTDCPGGKCDGGCTLGCYRCSPGNQYG